MFLLKLRLPLASATLWIALLPTALPADETELRGQSDKYSASVRLSDGMLVIAIVNKISGKEVSNRVETKATRLTGMRFLDNEGEIIVFGKVGGRGDIRFEFEAATGYYHDRIYRLRSESQNYSLSVGLDEAYPPEVEYRRRVLDITVVNKASGAKVFRRTPTDTAKLTDLYILGAQHRLIVHGKLGRRGDVLSVVNLKNVSVVDTIWGWQASFSPDQTKVAYNFRYPPHAMHQHRTSVLLIYDFTATPRENSVRDEDMTNPETRGHVIYPKRNREQGKHFIPAMSEVEQIYFESPIAWSHGGTRVALLESVQGDTHLLVADLANGLEAPEISRTQLEKERYCEPPTERQERRHYETVPIRAENFFRFGKDDQSILFTTNGCWSGEIHEVVMELD